MRFRTALLLLGLGFGGTPSPSAHESLYEWIEIRVDEDGSAEVEFTIHAASLVPDWGIDPTSSDDSWFAQLDPSERQELGVRAIAWITAFYEIKVNEGALLTVDPIVVPASLDNAARPGCFAATASFLSNSTALSIDYRGKEKRLMVVTIRPGAFPRTIDLAPLESRTFQLLTKK